MALPVISRTTLAVCGLAALAGFLVAVPACDLRRSKAKPAEDAPVPLFATTERATNPVKLHLLIDDGKVLGWVSGAEDFDGKQVVIRADGKEQRVKMQEDNTFTWEYHVTRTTRAEFELAGGSANLKASATLTPKAEREPTVFFVTDRTVYRPGQPLHFAGFLRKLDADGQFTPLTNQAVEVHVTSEKKKTVAGKLKLTSDAFGRVTGFYPFLEADALDTYTLSIPNYKGAARVALAEFRKSKINLKIAGTVEDGNLKLTFDAVDFLDKPIAGAKVQFTAQIVRNSTAAKKATLKAEDYVYHLASGPNYTDLDNLPEEDMLLWEAGVPLAFGQGRSGPQVLAEVTGDVQVPEQGPGEYGINLQADWLKDGHAVVVQGVLIDQNGREQRAVQTIPLEQKTRALGLSIPKRYFEMNEPITVTLDLGDVKQTSASLVAMRLTPTANYPAYYGRAYSYRSARAHQIISLNNFVADQLTPNGGMPRGLHLQNWNVVDTEDILRRNLENAVPFQGNTAALKLAQPGAYKLVAIVHLRDGGRVQKEVGCVVRGDEDRAGLILKLNQTEYASGDALQGELHSRFDGARVLLTLRDSAGIRFWKPVQVQGGVLRLREALPEDLRYGCYVEAQYLDQAGHLHLASTFIHVKPEGRTLAIKTSMKEVVGPGETVKIDLQVNRNEPVDLVVSVYDQSLLGIAPDKSVDIRNFYLADETVRHGYAREVLRRRLGDVTVGELLERARKLHKQHTRAGRPQENALANLLTNWRSRHLSALDVATLLRLGGLAFRLEAMNHNPFGSYWYYHQFDQQEVAGKRLLDVLETLAQGQWRLSYRFHNHTLVLRESHPSYDAQAQQEMAQGFNQFRYGRGGFGARGDSHISVSGNSSFTVSGQSFISHLPGAGAPVELIGADADQGSLLVRRDFSDLAFWKADVRTDDTGKATVEFKVPDSLTNWQVAVTAVSRDGHVGQHKCRFRTFKPIMVWPMLPRTFTQGDRVAVYASVHNCTDEPQTIRVRLKVENGEILGREETLVVVEPKSNRPVYWDFKPRDAGFTQLLMTAACTAGSDASLKRLPVTAVAAEQILTVSGFCKDQATLRIPDGVDLKTSSLEITFAPSLMADLVDTLSYLVEYPHGCVEQTMSRFLPAIKVAQILKQFRVEHKELEAKLPKCVEAGIKRLLELQQPDGGWAWHGGGQTHEMMTPYALYGLLQAEKAGYDIPNEQALQRGLARLQQFIQGMNDNQTSDRLYCMYVFAHRNDITPEWWNFVADQLDKNRLSDYALALALEMAVQKGKKDIASGLADQLRGRAQKSEGRVFWRTAGFSRWGDDQFEVTAAGLKALVAYDVDDALVPGVLQFFAATKRGNRWNSTKDTAMITYALCDYLARQEYHHDRIITTFSVNGAKPQRIVFPNGQAAKATIPATHLRVGDNQIKFLSGGPGVLFRAVFRYWQGGAEIAPMNKGIQVVRQFYLLDDKGQRVKELKPGDAVPRGAYLESEVTATHGLGTQMRYVLVENPKPSSCEIQPVEDRRFQQQSTAYALREDKEAKVVYHHEQTNHVLQDRCVLHAELAGDYVVAPAVVELMYQTETRGHSGTFCFRVEEEKAQK